MPRDELSELLTRHRARLVRYFERKGASLRHHESAEDLAQGVHLHALANRRHFRYEGDRQFVGWMLKVARQYLGRRVEHWSAAKRDAGPMLRITFGAVTRDGTVAIPATDEPGPATHASRNEQLALAARAIDGLPPRDRLIVRMMTREAPSAEIAAELGISAEAAKKARQRAMERFRKIYTILERQGPTAAV